MSNWGISPNASEKEKIKADYADILHGMNSTGVIPYDVYSDLFDDGMELFDRMYEQGKADGAEPVKHGRWLNWKPKHLGMEHSYDTKECSECGHTMHNALIIPAYYCPNCGAKMDLEE